jgi:hypothetical protein
MARWTPWLRGIAWTVGILYLFVWGLLFWFLYDGQLIRGAGACEPILVFELSMWRCQTGTWIDFLAGTVNLTLAMTVWAPAFTLYVSHDPSYWTLVTPIFMAHAIGLPSALYVLLRAATGVLDARRH